MPEPKRKYNSTRRQQQSQQTRRQIIQTARKLFGEGSYAGTTIEAIAQEAGVAAETIYALFGSKRAILLNLVNVTLVDDDQPVPLLDRPFIQEAGKETDPHRLIRKFATDIYGIMTRMSPIFSLLRTTAKNDPEVTAMLDRILSERLRGMAFFIEQLRRTTSLRESIAPEEAAITVWTLSSAEVFDLLTRDQGWSQEQYISWLSDSVERLLLPIPR